MTSAHILLIDGDNDIREVTRLSLEAIGGYQVSAYSSGEDAIPEAPRERFDLLLIETLLPGMSGIQTLAALREMAHLEDVPAVFLTTATHARDMEEYRRCDVVDIVAKPFQPGALCDRLQSILSMGSTAAPSRNPDDSAQQGQHAFLIDDDPTSLFLLRFILEQQGCRVQSAPGNFHSPEALTNPHLAQDTAIVILDLAFANNDGQKLLARIRSLSDWDNVPILVLSALRDEATISNALASGADDYLCKPFDLFQAADRIKRLVQHPRRNAS